MKTPSSEETNRKERRRKGQRMDNIVQVVVQLNGTTKGRKFFQEGTEV